MSRKNNNRTINMSFKVNAAEEKVIREAANHAEMHLSEYIRMSILNQAKTDRYERELKKSSG
jgi:uncharacterized protein (DUF1778 family)